MDYIRKADVRKILLNALGKIPAEIVNTRIEWKTAYDALLEATKEVDALLSVSLEANQWFSVHDCLPENEDKVLCQTVTKKGIPGFVLGYYYHGRWVSGMNSNVIAWRPLPDPYTEEGGTENGEEIH